MPAERRRLRNERNWMTDICRALTRVLLVWGCALSLVALPILGVSAQVVAPSSIAEGFERAPRFLYVESPRATPRGVDVGRMTVLRRTLALDLDGIGIKQALSIISSEARLDLAYSDRDLPPGAKVHLKAGQITVAAALTEVLLDAGLDVVFTASGSATLVKRPEAGVPPAFGMIVGRVTDSSTQQGIWQAKVSVQGTKLNTNSDAEGRFIIRQVPVGDRIVSVKLLGYVSATQSVSVVENGTAIIAFVLTRAPTKLADLVTTATGDRRRLEVGNSVGTIQADSIVPTTLIRNVSDLLQARVPGAIVTNTDGAVGAPSKIRLRGVTSLALNNDPIIILDGVRLNAQTTQANNQLNVGSVTMLQQMGANNVVAPLAPSRLDDIDPNTIESIDILRGPSASSLYGTDAANGVIVIKTKRGRSGSWRGELSGDRGTSAIPGSMGDQWWGYGPLFRGDYSNACTLTTGGQSSVTGGTCTQDSVHQFNPQNYPAMKTLGTGTTRSVNGSLSGGSETLQELLSLRLSDEVGMAKMSDVEQRAIQRLWNSPVPSWMVRPNTQTGIDASSRMTVQISPKASIDFGTQGLYRDVLNGGSGVQPFAGTDPSDSLHYLPAESQRTKLTSLSKRGILSTNAQYAPWSWLTLTATGGGDYTIRTDEALLRAQDCTVILNPNGCPSGHVNRRDEVFVTTVNVGARFMYSPLSWVNLQTSLGEQYSKTNFYSLQAGSNCPLAFGTDLLTPSPICRNFFDQPFSIQESRDASASAGWYVEQGVSLFGLYTSFGFREDVASAFGRNVTKTPPKYPKLSLSYPLSEQAFFRRQSLVSNLRLRLAYGQSGNQASQAGVFNNFAQTPLTFAGSATPVDILTIQTMGNADLRPERGTEWEGGFDASFFDNERVQTSVTLYRRFTRDAITQVQLPPSVGVNALQRFENLGDVQNRGSEVSISAKVLDLQQLGWDVRVNLAHNTNKLVKKAPGLNQNGPGNTQFREGYPLYGFWGAPVKSFADRNGDGILAVDEISFGALAYMGAPYPKAEVSYGSDFTLFGGALHLGANLDQIVGSVQQRYISAGLPRAAVDRTTSLAAQAAWVQASLYNPGAYIIQSSSLRFNELSMTYNLPARATQRFLHARSLALTVAGRNLALWTNYVGKDPNVDDSSAFGEVTTDGGRGVPQPRNWILRFNLGL
jgi:TonB-dependent SusC/RagA subfamily outer membrane receptor